MESTDMEIFAIQYYHYIYADYFYYNYPAAICYNSLLTLESFPVTFHLHFT